jgi:hypothetical protein
MTEEPRELTSEELAEKRAALDRVLVAALAERTDMISLYDCAVWLLYACTRSDAISAAKEMQEKDDRGEDGESYWEDYTIDDEIAEQRELAEDDGDSAVSHEHDIRSLGNQLDPEFNLPVIQLTDWLDDPKPDPESSETMRRVVDNAIDSSRRAAKRREK